MRQFQESLFILSFSLSRKWQLKSSGSLESVVLQPFGWRCAECAVNHERNVREEQQHIYVARTSNNRVIVVCNLWWCERLNVMTGVREEWSRWSDLGEWPVIMLVNLVNSWPYMLMVMTRVISSGEIYCCLLPQCEALRTCRSGLRTTGCMVQFLCVQWYPWASFCTWKA